eukprot:TRINITY_DN4071_c0_g1_i2.p2 TRINITY_DN4071_c0_g1~~TRINITY_DN4071_c0_g1_i2.p2  ORF type:complete len:212 (+),score=43.64 TRINITY_DN4071_c0_g1_i2:359-994(+)
MRVVPVPVLDDNYAYLIIDDKTKNAIAVDPAQPDKVLAAAEKEGVHIKAVATTHHHWDHAGGNTEMKKLLPQVEILGGDDRIDHTRKVGHGDEYRLDDLHVRVFFTPCHTSGHVLYLVNNSSNGNSGAQALFTGDTLFIGGCGRFFEGTAEQMDYALNTVVAALPHDTLVYCGHEYTVKNLEFALSIEPDNQDIKASVSYPVSRIPLGHPI